MSAAGKNVQVSPCQQRNKPSIPCRVHCSCPRTFQSCKMCHGIGSGLALALHFPAWAGLFFFLVIPSFFFFDTMPYCCLSCSQRQLNWLFRSYAKGNVITIQGIHMILVKGSFWAMFLSSLQKTNVVLEVERWTALRLCSRENSRYLDFMQ